MANQFLIFDSLSFTDDCRALGRGYRELPKALAKKTIKAAVTRAVKPFVPALRAVTPKGKLKRAAKAAARAAGQKNAVDVSRPGRLKRSIIMRTTFTNKVDHGSFQAKVTFSRGKGKGNHAILVERGTVDRKNIDGASRGKVSPRLFIQSLFNSMAPGIAASMNMQLAAGLEAAGRQLQNYIKNRKR
jgi:hypothetical protein